MPGLRDFRFATGSYETIRAGVLAEAHKAEALGYHVYIMSDHLGSLAPIPLLMMAAENVGMRVGSYVLCNDFRHPVVMAQEAATLDVLSNGRLELGPIIVGLREPGSSQLQPAPRQSVRPG